jgi:hypothetical protein
MLRARTALLTYYEQLSLVIGFILSLLGSALLFLGQLGSFAGESAEHGPLASVD